LDGGVYLPCPVQCFALATGIRTQTNQEFISHRKVINSLATFMLFNPLLQTKVKKPGALQTLIFSSSDMINAIRDSFSGRVSFKESENRVWLSIFNPFPVLHPNHKIDDCSNELKKRMHVRLGMPGIPHRCCPECRSHFFRRVYFISSFIIA